MVRSRIRLIVSQDRYVNSWTSAPRDEAERVSSASEQILISTSIASPHSLTLTFLEVEHSTHLSYSDLFPALSHLPSTPDPHQQKKS